MTVLVLLAFTFGILFGCACALACGVTDLIELAHRQSDLIDDLIDERAARNEADQ